jgi:hypothetical protein
MLEYGKERCGSVTTMTELARWWQRREKFAWGATVSGKVLQIKAAAADSSLSVTVEQGERRATIPAREAAYELPELDWQPLPEPVPFDPRSLAARKHSLLHRARSLNRRARKTLRGHRG